MGKDKLVLVPDSCAPDGDMRRQGIVNARGNMQGRRAAQMILRLVRYALVIRIGFVTEKPPEK